MVHPSVEGPNNGNLSEGISKTSSGLQASTHILNLVQGECDYENHLAFCSNVGWVTCI